MFSANHLVAELPRLLLGEHNNPACTVGEWFKHPRTLVGAGAGVPGTAHRTADIARVADPVIRPERAPRTASAELRAQNDV